LSCSALIRSQADRGSEPKSQSWYATPKSRAQSEELAYGRLVLARLRTPGRAELPYGLQHPEPHAGRGVGDGEQRLVGQLLQQEQRVLAEHLFGRFAGEAAGEDGQRAQRRPGVLGEQVPAPLHDRVQGAVALRHVPCPAAQQREPVAEAAGDVRHRQDPHPRRRQLHGERQPVEVPAQLGHRVRRQLHAAPGGPGPLREQLDRGAEAELRQRVHRLRGEAERGPAGGEHPQVLGGRDQGLYEVGGAPDDLLAVVEDQQRGPGAEHAEDAGHRVAGDVGRPMAPGRPGPAPSAEATSAATSASAVTPASGTKYTTRCSARRLTACASRVLPRPPGPTTVTAREARSSRFHRRDVLVPAEQRIRLVRHTVPGHGRLTAQQLLLYGLESGARIGAELVAQLTAVRLVPGQRGGRARRRRLAAQQLGEHLLVARMLHGGHGQRPGGLRVPSEAGERERLRADERVADGGALGAQCGHGVVGVAALVRGAFPQGESGLGRGQRSRVVPGPGPVRARRRRAAAGRSCRPGPRRGRAGIRSAC
jgi:hypothetical protein